MPSHRLNHMNAAHPGSCTDIPPESPAAPGLFGRRPLAACLPFLSAAFSDTVEPQATSGSDIDQRHVEDALFTGFPGRVALPGSEIADATSPIASPIALPIEGRSLHISCDCFANPVCSRTFSSNKRKMRRGGRQAFRSLSRTCSFSRKRHSGRRIADRFAY